MKTRLVAITLTALLPALGMVGYNEVQARKIRHGEIHRQTTRSAQQIASEISTALEGLRGILNATAAIPAISGNDHAACDAALETVATRLTLVRNIIVLDTHGKLICDNMGWASGMDFSDRDYVREAFQTDQVVVGEYTVARVSSQPILPLALRLKRGDEVIGVIATGMRLEWLQSRISQRTLPESSFITVTDRKGVIIARNPDPQRFVGNTIPSQYSHLINAAGPGTLEETDDDGTERIIGYQPVKQDNPFYVSTGISKDVALKPVNQATITGLIMLVSGGLFAFLAATYLGRRFVVEPIHQVVNVVSRWREGDYMARTGMAGLYGELGVVGASVDGLLDELELRRQASMTAEEKRRLMARELSHRIKNTLAVLQAIARQTFRGQEQEIASFQSRVSALAGGYDALLSEDGQRADLSEVIARVMKPYGAADGGPITLDGPPLQLEPDVAVALSLILHELGTNALKYGCLSTPGGHLTIGWQKNADRISLIWQERGGPPVSAPEREGFGSKLIRNAFPGCYDPQISKTFAPEGLEFQISFCTLTRAGQ
ncbi:sensor histidine kinase [Rhizobium sp. FY34]|uniref:sensor histidine kinase n=1 Tax=Rhizobium sp. FY34 TaxID=2562309 RepID=UPI0014854368|nr:sensor histidine kinase [Rhizobium sp. FY34]